MHTEAAALVRAHIGAFNGGDIPRLRDTIAAFYCAADGYTTYIKVYREGSADPG